MDEKTLIHTRNITVNTYELDKGRLLVEGTLTDDRLFPSYYYSTKEFVEPGIIHHFVVRLSIHLPELIITAAEVDMIAVPHKLCREVSNVIEKLAGIDIKRGFTQRVRGLMGGAHGCLHLTNLILTMGSAAVQGQWAYYSREGGKRDVMIPEANVSMLENSCWLWRKDGPYIKRFKEMQKDRKGKVEKPENSTS